MKTTLTHFENGDREFLHEADFIIFIKKIAKENGDDQAYRISSYTQCLVYVLRYCSNFIKVVCEK